MSRYLKLSLLALCGFASIDMRAMNDGREHFQDLVEASSPAQGNSSSSSSNVPKRSNSESRSRKSRAARHEAEMQRASSTTSSSSSSIPATRRGSPYSPEEAQRQHEMNFRMVQEHLRQRATAALSSSSSESSSMIAGLTQKTLDGDMNPDVILDNSPRQIKTLISNIKRDIYREKGKNILLIGYSGMGKSTIPLALAKKYDIPCYFIDCPNVSTAIMNSNTDNLGDLFKLALLQQKKLGKPCIIVLDELEALTSKHINKNCQDNNPIRSLGCQLDAAKNSKVIVIATMNNADDLSAPISRRFIKVTPLLPTQQQRESILTAHMEI